MTTEYVSGEEDVYLSIYPRDDGNVSLAVFLTVNDEKIYGVVLPPEVARSAAEKLTMSSWKAEDLKKGQAE